MTNVEFQKKLESMYESHPIITKGPRKTFNELAWVLRQDDVDYNISVHEDNTIMCIVSVKECFIPVKTLAKHVAKVELDEYDYGFNSPDINLTVWLED